MLKKFLVLRIKKLTFFLTLILLSFEKILDLAKNLALLLLFLFLIIVLFN